MSRERRVQSSDKGGKHKGGRGKKEGRKKKQIPEVCVLRDKLFLASSSRIRAHPNVNLGKKSAQKGVS